MSKAQIENGYTKIANDLLEKIYSFTFTKNEIRIFLAIVRLSYGWNEKTTADRAEARTLQLKTGLRPDHIFAAIKGLKAKNSIACAKCGKSNEYSINTDLDSWIPSPDCETKNVALIRGEYRPNSGLPETGQNIDPIQGKTQTRFRVKHRPDSGQNIDPIQGYETGATRTTGAAHQSAKEIKEIKETKESKENTSNFSYKKLLESLGLPPTAILSSIDQSIAKKLFETGCNYEDIAAARIKRKKNKLEWIQANVCEERDARLAKIALPDHNGIPLFANGQMDWESMSVEQKSKAMQLGYER